MDRAAQAHQCLEGPIVPLNIGFNADDTVDFDRVGAYVDWLASRKTKVILLTYGSSEFAALSDEQLWKLTETVGKANAGRSMYIASTGWWTVPKCREFLKHCDAVGADAVKVQINPWYGMAADGPRQKVLRTYFDRLEGACDIPLMLWSHAMGPLPIALIEELARRPNIIGMKNDCDPFDYYYKACRATEGQQFGVCSGGQMRNFLFGHQIGSPAYLCPIAPFRPDIPLVFYQHLVDGQPKEAAAMVFRYEDPFLGWAVAREWLAVQKSAIMLLGFYKDNRTVVTGFDHCPKLVDQVRSRLQELSMPPGPR